MILPVHAAVSSNAPAQVPPGRLVGAAHEFEAQMMKELLKPMMSATGIDSGDDATDSGFEGALGEFASESLGRALSERGGVGIAGEIIHDISRNGTSARSGMLTGKLQSSAPLGDAQ